MVVVRVVWRYSQKYQAVEIKHQFISALDYSLIGHIIVSSAYYASLNVSMTNAAQTF